MNLSGNKILITGGSSGIGLALALKFVELGNEVIITGRDREKLERARQHCQKLVTIQCDARNEAGLDGLKNEIYQNHSDLNILINNAGVLVSRNLLNQPENLSELTNEIDINIKGTVKTTSLLLDILVKNRGTIVNVSSGLAFVPMMSAPIYCGTKAFIHSYSKSLRFQLESEGVRVVELAPPAVKTNMTARLPEDGFFNILSLEELVRSTIKGLETDVDEIHPGQSRYLKFMSRLAPRFIERKLASASRNYMPKRV